jgi:inosine-uridine nucleoside N-ribohydrolase
MTAKIKVLMDCDPGHDDAFALIVATKFADVIGVTTVAGNAPLSLTTKNARIILDLCGSNAPLHSGAGRPLVAEPIHAAYIHGESGMDGANLPEPSRPADGTNAVYFIIDTVRANPGLWLVPTGPLTNIALALRAAPDLVDKISGISIMGGGRFGNRTATAEFNIWCDPEAAAAVFDSGAKIIMSGLHLTHQIMANPKRIEMVREAHAVVGPMLAGLLEFFSKMYKSLHDDFEGAPLHDVCAVLALTHPQLFTSKETHVAVELDGTHTRGMTVIDDRHVKSRTKANTQVLETIDADAAFAVIVDAVSSCVKS